MQISNAALKEWSRVTTKEEMISWHKNYTPWLPEQILEGLNQEYLKKIEETMEKKNQLSKTLEETEDHLSQMTLPSKTQSLLKELIQKSKKKKKRNRGKGKKPLTPENTPESANLTHDDSNLSDEFNRLFLMGL